MSWRLFLAGPILLALRRPSFFSIVLAQGLSDFPSSLNVGNDIPSVCLLVELQESPLVLFVDGVDDALGDFCFLVLVAASVMRLAFCNQITIDLLKN